MCFTSFSCCCIFHVASLTQFSSWCSFYKYFKHRNDHLASSTFTQHQTSALNFKWINIPCILWRWHQLIINFFVHSVTPRYKTIQNDCQKSCFVCYITVILLHLFHHFGLVRSCTSFPSYFIILIVLHLWPHFHLVTSFTSFTCCCSFHVILIMLCLLHLISSFSSYCIFHVILTLLHLYIISTFIQLFFFNTFFLLFLF